MIEAIYIIHHESGVPLLHVDFQSSPAEGRPAPDLFGGALQGIRLFLKESKIGDLTEFETNDRRIEIRCDKNVVVAIVSGIDSPPHDVVDVLVEDIAALFETEFKDTLLKFKGNVRPFDSFVPELVRFVNLQIDQATSATRNDAKGLDPGEISLPESTRAKTAILATGITVPGKRGMASGHKILVDLSSLESWLNNRFGLGATIQYDVCIKGSPDARELVVDALFDAGERNLNRLDRWLAPRMAPGGTRDVVLVFYLDPEQGPATVRGIIESCGTLGDPDHARSKDVFAWFPAGLVFIGPGVQESTFDGLGDIIKEYKDKRILIASYADHLHREHSPHHAFFRCGVSGWRWRPGSITAENFPVQVYPPRTSS